MTSIVHDEYLCPIERKTETGHSFTDDDRLWAPFPGGARNDQIIYLLMLRRSYFAEVFWGMDLYYYLNLDKMVPSP